MDLCGQYSSHVKATNVLIHTYIPAFQTPSDVEAGRLDHLIARAEADIAADNVRDLDEILHNG